MEVVGVDGDFRPDALANFGFVRFANENNR